MNRWPHAAILRLVPERWNLLDPFVVFAIFVSFVVLSFSLAAPACHLP